MTPLLEITDLVKHFPITSGVLVDRQIGQVRAVDGVSFVLNEGETLGLVGESGCGKSTLCRVILQLTAPTSGSVRFRGVELVGRSRRDLRPLRREVQMIFQDPFASLNPRRRVGQIIGDPMRLHGIADGAELKSKVAELLERVGLHAEHYNRFPHEFSGGQRQRLAIARCLATKPELIIADEIVSALDVSIQAQIVNLLREIQGETGLSFMFVTHDVAVARYVGHRVAVMYLGSVVEILPAESLPEAAEHPYTIALLSAVPSMNPDRKAERIILQGEVPSPIEKPSGCAFSTRCAFAMDICRSERPELRPSLNSTSGHEVACHLIKGAN